MHRQTAGGWADHRALAGANPEAELRPLAAVLSEDGLCAPALAVRVALNVAALVREARAERGSDVGVDPRDVLLGSDGRVVVREFAPAVAGHGSSSRTRLGGIERVFFSLVCGRLVTNRSDARDLRHRLPADAPAALRQLLDACLGIGAEPPPGTLDELIVWLATVESALSPGAHPDRRAVDELRLRVEEGTSSLRRALDLATRFGVDAAALPDRDTLAATMLPAGMVDAGREPAVARRALEAVATRLDDTMGTLDRVLRERLERQFGAVVDLARRLRSSPDGLLEPHEAAALDDCEKAARHAIAVAPPADAAETMRDFELTLESLRAALAGRMRERLAAALARVATLMDAIEQAPDEGGSTADLEPARLRAACEEQIAAGDFAAAGAVLEGALKRLEDRAGMAAEHRAGLRIGGVRSPDVRGGQEIRGNVASVNDPALPAGQQGMLAELLERLPRRPGAPSPEVTLREKGERLLAGIDVARARRMAPELIERLVVSEHAAQAAAAAGDESGLLAELVRTVDVLECLAGALGQGAASGTALAALTSETGAEVAGSDRPRESVRVSPAIALGAYAPEATGAWAREGEEGRLDLWVVDTPPSCGATPGSGESGTGAPGQEQRREPALAATILVATLATLALAGVLSLRGAVLFHAAPALVHAPRILAAWPPGDRLLGPDDGPWTFALALDSPPDPVLGPHWSIDGRPLPVHGASLVLLPDDPRRPRQPSVVAARIGSGFHSGSLRIWRVEPTFTPPTPPGARRRSRPPA